MKETESNILDELSRNLEIDLHEKRTMAELKLALSGYINYLISHDRDKLMRILYRVDVSEKILRTNLQNQETDAASIIADLVIERQLEKIRSKNEFKPDDDIPENEKW